MQRFVLALPALLAAFTASAADQTIPGAGNEAAARLAASSPRVREAHRFLVEQAGRIQDPALRAATLDMLANREVCARHRVGLDDAAKAAILQRLSTAGLLNPADGAAFPGGATAGVFPPVLAEGTRCPRPPQPFESAPGGAFGGHHSYPGGLPIHEALNERSSQSLAGNYRRNYDRPAEGEFVIDPDVMIAAPIWHDWAKTIVFQWNADGTEFAELNFGGAGKTDNNGAPGDSRTGGHHILGVAETMKRGLSPAFVIAQASAHSAPTLGNEYKVVNWLRAAAIIAGIDPVAKGYLHVDGAGHYRLPPLRQLGNLDLNAARPSQTNLLAEYVLHNLSDADFTYTGPALGTVQVILAKLAPRFGYDPADAARYNTQFRNPVLSNLSAERLMILYSAGGLEEVAEEIGLLRDRGVI